MGLTSGYAAADDARDGDARVEERGLFWRLDRHVCALAHRAHVLPDVLYSVKPSAQRSNFRPRLDKQAPDRSIERSGRGRTRESGG